MKMSQAATADKEYDRFKFPGFVSQGTCFLRARVRQSGLVVLCSQLLNYHGTSVTNAAEGILIAAIDQLQADVGLDHLVPVKPWWPFRTTHNKFIAEVVRRTAWIEYYPPGAGVSLAGSIALVTFDENLNPVWNYVSKGTAAAECGVDEAFLDVDIGLLNYDG